MVEGFGIAFSRKRKEKVRWKSPVSYRQQMIIILVMATKEEREVSAWGNTLNFFEVFNLII